MKKFLFLPLLLSVLFFNSCQEEGIELLQEDEEQVVAANSVVADLMLRTASRDGSSDNIIDGASCMNVELPVTVFVNGLEIIIDSEEDFDVIEAIFDEIDDDYDSLDIVFPIKIILSNHEEIVVNNQDELELLIKECSSENEDDDDIECVDFVYPLVYSVFDTDSNSTNTVTINSDRDMYRFIKTIDKNDVVALNFPVSLKYSDGEVVTINTIQELENALSVGIDFCDEDDDNDYCDDDFDIEELNELLKICPWFVKTIYRNDDNLIERYREFAIVFEEEGVVRARNANGEILIGAWELKETDTNGVQLVIEFDTIEDFTLVWNVCKVGDERIKLYDANSFSGINPKRFIVLKKNCDIIFDYTADDIENILTECFWRVHKLYVDDIYHEGKYIGTPIKFLEDGVAKLRINGEYVQGTWEIVETSIGFSLQMSFDNRPNLNLEWQISNINNYWMQFKNETSEFIIKKNCPESDEDVEYINQTIIEDQWDVAYFEEDGVNETEHFLEYVLDFKDTGRVNVEKDNQNFSGSWLAYRYDSHLRLGLNFGENDPFYELNNRWKIIEITPNRIELIDYSSTGAIEKKLVLEKN